MDQNSSPQNASDWVALKIIGLGMLEAFGKAREVLS